jgi:porin
MMVAGVQNLAKDWSYDVVSIAYPGPVCHTQAQTRQFDKQPDPPLSKIGGGEMKTLGRIRVKSISYARCKPDTDSEQKRNTKNEKAIMSDDNGNPFRCGLRWWEKPKVLGPMLLLLLGVGVACAQERPLPSAASEVATNVSSGPQIGNRQDTNTATGLFEDSSSDNSQVPVHVRPFTFTLPREPLLGDWYGLRLKLEELGITPTVTYVIDIAGNPTGGKSQGVTYADNLGLGLLFDLGELAGLNGGSFLLSMSQRDGDSLSKERVGNVFTIQQVYGGETFHLIDLAYQQKLLDDRVELRLGRMGAGDDFLVSPYNYLFMQNGFDGNPVGIFFNSPGMSAYPNATWGARFKVRPTKRAYVMAGIYNGDSSIRADDNHGTDMSMNGPVFVIGEVGYRRNGLPGDTQLLGNYKAGFWYDGNRFTDYRTVGYGLSAGSKQGSWGFYGLFDQVLIPFAEPASNRGLGILGSLMVAPDQSVNQIPYFFTAGVALRGIFASRPSDAAGFGVVFGEFSGDLRDAEQREQLLDPTVGVQSHETVLEWTYRFNVRKGALFFQPDLQYVIRPGGTREIANAVVLGCQAGINL